MLASKPEWDELVPELNAYFAKFLISKRIAIELADDLIQNTWEAYLSKPSSFQERSHLRTYLTGILINKVFEEQRRVRKCQNVERLLMWLGESSSLSSGSLWDRAPRQPDFWILRTQVQQVVMSCLFDLSDLQRKVFKLTVFEGRNRDEVCVLLNVSPGYLRVCLHRAKEKLSGYSWDEVLGN